MRLEGKKAIVTGASQGIGWAIAQRFALEGAEVLLCDIKAPTQELLPNQRFHELDVRDPDGWAGAVSTIGTVDILVNNAGLIDTRPLDDVTVESWDFILDVDLKGVMLGMRAALPSMISRGGGSIVNLSSIWGTTAVSGAAAYHAAKGAVKMLSKNAAITYASSNVRVNSLHPGIVATPYITDVQLPELTQVVVGNTPLGRLGRPDEVANAALFLASDESSFVTGSELYVDGGYTAQ